MRQQNTKTGIGISMRQLQKAFDTALSPRVAKTLAFHLAELKPELVAIAGILTRIEKTTTVSTEAIKTIVYSTVYHWPYHLKEIKKLVLSSALEKGIKEKRGHPLAGPPAPKLRRNLHGETGKA